MNFKPFLTSEEISFLQAQEAKSQATNPRLNRLKRFIVLAITFSLSSRVLETRHG